MEGRAVGCEGGRLVFWLIFRSYEFGWCDVTTSEVFWILMSEVGDLLKVEVGRREVK